MKALIIGLLLLAGCATSKFHPGTYRVSSVKNLNGSAIVKLEGFDKEFVLPTDTLKKGDLVYFVEKPDGVIPGSTVKNK